MSLPTCLLACCSLLAASSWGAGAELLGAAEPTPPGATSSLATSLWPPVSSLIRSSWDVVQGRGKQKGGGHGMMMMGGMMLMMALSGLAALAGKALAASMAALMLAAMSLMKKGGGGGHHSTYEVVTVPHTGGGHHHRSIAEGEASGPVPYALPTSYGVYDTSVESLPPHPTERH